MPARFREILNAKASTQIVITFLEGCLLAYPMDKWQEVLRRTETLATSQPDVRTFLRIFHSRASECQVDRQGRILIPENLRERAGLEKEVFIVGVGQKFEIWSRLRWDQDVEPAEERVVEIARVADIRF